MRKNVYDISDKARFYAERPYPHYKFEVYSLFADILSTLENGDVVLDIGGGPGHLAYEFFGKYPDKEIEFWILDGSRELLKYAENRLSGRDRIHTRLIDFNTEDWRQGLPGAKAIVCNNALFHLKPERLPTFYEELSGLLSAGGFYLNQQSMQYPGGYEPYKENAITRFLSNMPYDVMPQEPQFSELECRKNKERESHIKARLSEEVAMAKAEEDVDPLAYYFHSVEEHLRALRFAGMEATTIWQKKEFYVILGIKE